MHLLTMGKTMRDEQHQFMSLWGQLPARLTGEQAAWMLNCQPHDIPALLNARLLKPLGNPAANGTKFFATVEVVELAKDRHWLARMTQAITRHWQKKNGVRQTQEAASVPEMSPERNAA